MYRSKTYPFDPANCNDSEVVDAGTKAAKANQPGGIGWEVATVREVTPEMGIVYVGTLAEPKCVFNNDTGTVTALPEAFENKTESIVKLCDGSDGEVTV